MIHQVISRVYNGFDWKSIQLLSDLYEQRNQTRILPIVLFKKLLNYILLITQLYSLSLSTIQLTNLDMDSVQPGMSKWNLSINSKLKWFFPNSFTQSPDPSINPKNYIKVGGVFGTLDCGIILFVPSGFTEAFTPLTNTRAPHVFNNVEPWSQLWWYE